jgi:hypothetical protein
MDEREELLLMLWRADEATRPKRESFRVMRISKRRGTALIRHSGLRAVGDHPFIHRSPQEIEDLIDQRLLRRTIPKEPPGQWEVDLTEEGRTRAAALHSSASLMADKPGVGRFLELIDDRIAAANEQEREKLQVLRDAAGALAPEQLEELLSSFRR